MRWFAILGIAATIAVWAAVFLTRYLEQKRQPQDRDRASVTRAIHAIIVLSWSFWVIPSVVGLLQNGRANTQFSVAEVSAAQRNLQLLISTALAAVCCHVILRSIHRAPTASIWRLGVFVLPWITIVVISGVNSGYLSGRQFLLYPLIAATFWIASPPLSVVRTIGLLGVLTAGVSMVAAVLTPLAVVDGGVAGVDKAIIGNGHSLLAGPYSDANGFALTLALAAPCLLTVERRALRIAGLTVVGVALLWTAGRTSILAAAAGLAVFALTVQASRRRLKILGIIAVVAGSALVVLTPLTNENPHAFTSRGIVWALSLADWRHHHLWLGGGPLYYERSEFLGYVFSFKVIAGHNLMVDTLVRGGLVGALAVAAMFGVAGRQAARLASRSAFPLAFLVTFSFLSWLEVPLSLANLGFLGFASWLPLAVIFFSGETTREGHALAPVPRRLEVVAA